MSIALTMVPVLVQAQDPVAALEAHLKEMQTHLAIMKKAQVSTAACDELERHMREMTKHMEMMMVMMNNLAAEKERPSTEEH